MALDATVGGTSANSYVTLAEAATLLEGRLGTEVWFEHAETMAQREQALQQATSLLEMHTRWYSRPATTTQALSLPQTGLIDEWGRSIAQTVIPQAVKLATALYALALLQELYDEAQGGGSSAPGIKSKKMGDITITYQDVSAAATPRKPTSPRLAVPAEVRALLRPYGTMTGSLTVPVVRA